MLRLGSAYALAIALALGFFVYQAYNAAGSLVDRQLGLRAADLARHVVGDAAGAPRLALPAALAAAYDAAPDSELFAIRAGDGRLIAASPARFGSEIAHWPTPPAAPSYFRLTNFGDDGADYYGYTTSAASAAGPLSITVAHRTEINPLVHTILLGFVLHIGWLVPIFLAVTLAIGLFAVRSGLQPMRELSRRTAAIGPAATSVRLPDAGVPSELKPLVGAINHALDRLEQGFVTQRQFTANAAHELRTPLTIVTGALEQLEGNGAADKLKGDVARMNRVVAQLLRVARLDALALDVAQPVDLVAAAGAVVALLAPWAIEQGRTVALAAAGAPLSITGNRDAVEDAIRNLVENAVAHAPCGSEVTVGVQPDAVTVTDRGPGVPAALRARIFERFWRGPERVGNGAGLGLAIVREIMAAHGGTVAVDAAPGGGASFTLRFPPSAPP
jgi:signal transduction histidine kinase